MCVKYVKFLWYETCDNLHFIITENSPCLQEILYECHDHNKERELLMNSQQFLYTMELRDHPGSKQHTAGLSGEKIQQSTHDQCYQGTLLCMPLYQHGILLPVGINTYMAYNTTINYLRVNVSDIPWCILNAHLQYWSNPLRFSALPQVYYIST